MPDPIVPIVPTDTPAPGSANPVDSEGRIVSPEQAALQEKHNAEMAALADAPVDGNNKQVVTPADAKPDAPVVPDKFKNEDGSTNHEALLKAYTTLEASQGKPPADDAKGDDKPDAKGDDKPVVADTVTAKAAAEYADKGELSEETFKALEAEGLDRPTVEAYVRGVESQRLLAFTAAGSEEAYNEMAEWAGANFTESEAEAYNLATGTDANPSDMVTAIQGLKARFEAERTVEPSLLQGTGPTSGPPGYKSGAEMRKDMGSKEYKTDQAFRDEVAQKMMRAEAAGINLFI